MAILPKLASKNDVWMITLGVLLGIIGYGIYDEWVNTFGHIWGTIIIAVAALVAILIAHHLVYVETGLDKEVKTRPTHAYDLKHEERIISILEVALLCLSFSFLFLLAYALYVYLSGYGILEIDPEYTDGILIASSILYGFWVIKLERVSTSRIANARIIFFTISILLLIMTVLFIAIDAVDPTYRIKALATAVFCFLMNIANLVLIQFLEWSHEITEIKK